MAQIAGLSPSGLAGFNPESAISGNALGQADTSVLVRRIRPLGALHATAQATGALTLLLTGYSLSGHGVGTASGHALVWDDNAVTNEVPIVCLGIAEATADPLTLITKQYIEGTGVGSVSTSASLNVSARRPLGSLTATGTAQGTLTDLRVVQNLLNLQGFGRATGSLNLKRKTSLGSLSASAFASFSVELSSRTPIAMSGNGVASYAMGKLVRYRPALSEITEYPAVAQGDLLLKRIVPLAMAATATATAVANVFSGFRNPAAPEHIMTVNRDYPTMELERLYPTMELI